MPIGALASAIVVAQYALVVVDRLSQCAAFGELSHGLRAGLIDQSRAVALGAIVAGRATGRTTDSQITIADLTGVGFQDTAIAAAATESTEKP